MSSINDKELTKIVMSAVNAALPAKPKPIVEAYVASPKKYDIPTESIPEDVKNRHNEIYKGYTSALTAISAQLDTSPRKDASELSSPIGSLKRDEIYNMNAVYLHELYFTNIGDVSSEIMQDNLSFMRLARDFGTFEDWQRDFIACGMSAREGWVVCGYSTYLRKYINFIVDLHDIGVPVGVYPVIVIDVWNHAIPADVSRKAYITKMMQEFNWEIIDNRFKRAEKIAEALK